MIVYRNGNLLDSNDPIICHGCNAQGVMGSGVALAIRNKWPRVFSEYRSFYEDHGLRLGDVIWVNADPKTPNAPWIGNLISQQNYGRDGQRYVSYPALEKGFEEVASFAETLKVNRVSIPKIGAGLGGGEWFIIESHIYNTLGHLDVTVWEL